jgi:glycosyltransferase involved in cell wall biosynthesis
MEGGPLVSIITIVYNGEKHIADCIRSVQRQDYPHIQYIIVDGGSKDNTLRIIEQFRGSISELISEKDEGISDAFNKGIRLAKGEIIGLINTDDWYEEGAVSKAVKAIENNDVVYGDLRFWRGEQPDHIARGNHHHLTREMTVNHPTVFIRKSCYDRFGLFDKQYKCAMDYDLLLRLRVNGCRFAYVHAVLANMRWGGFSDNRWMKGVKETMAVKNNYLRSRRLLNRLYFFKQVLAIGIPRYLNRLGLQGLVKVYRSRFAGAKRVYE